MDQSLNEIKAILKPLAAGASLNDIYRLLYHISLLKYSTAELLKTTHATAFKVATKPKLDKLVSNGFINEKFNVYTANAQTLEILKMVKINKSKVDIELLPNPPKGYGGINELNNSEVFARAIHRDYYYSLLYPNFSYVRPDALLVLKQNDEFRLTFLEIEADKSNWDDWLNRKRYNYLKLSKDIEVYNYWEKISQRLSLPNPGLSDFKFTVTVIGDTKKDWGKGFYFVENL